MKFDGARKIMKEPAPTSTRLAEALAAMRGNEAEARAEAARLTEARAGLLADDIALAKNRDAIRVCAERVEDCGLFAVELEKRLAAALAAEENVRRQAVYAAAKLRVEAAGSFGKEYARGAAIILKALRTLAEGQIAAAEANAELPDGAVGFADPEHAFTCIPGLPKKVLSEEIVDLWVVDGRTQPVDDQSRVVADKQGGVLHLPGSQASGGMRAQKGKFLRREVLPETYNVWLDLVSVKLNLPGIYSPMIVAWDGPSPHIVLQRATDAINAIEAAPARAKPTDIRKLVIEHVRVSTDGEVMG